MSGRRKPRKRLVDTYCAAGGAGAGYDRAGFDVIGVDKDPQPHYPFEFIQANALEVLADRDFMAQFDAAHASPPCQADSQMTVCRPGLAAEYPRLIEPTRKLLKAWGRPWVIENVQGADLPHQDSLLGAYGLRLRFRSVLAESAAIGEQMDRHESYREACIDPLLETDPQMAKFELELWFSTWNRIEERWARFSKWSRFYRRGAAR